MKIRVFFTVVMLLCVGCGGTQITESSGQPRESPEDARETSLPEGPDVDKDGVRPSNAPQVVEVETADEGAASEVGEVSRAEVEDFRDRGPAYVLTLVEFDPVHSDSGFVGFSLRSARSKASKFMNPHVQLGDVVTHVNGIRIERPDDLLQAWNAIGEASVIRLDMLRGGEPMKVTWIIED